MTDVPRELNWGDVYLSPSVPVLCLALIGAWLTVTLLNRARLSRYIMFPSTTFLGLMAFYILLINAFWIRI
jgi:hypothetical protein